ncbi:hypothetical protein FPV67DRAFT_1460796, partial [Lyophyllum atratum]
MAYLKENLGVQEDVPIRQSLGSIESFHGSGKPSYSFPADPDRPAKCGAVAYHTKKITNYKGNGTDNWTPAPLIGEQIVRAARMTHASTDETGLEGRDTPRVTSFDGRDEPRRQSPASTVKTSLDGSDKPRRQLHASTAENSLGVRSKTRGQPQPRLMRHKQSRRYANLIFVPLPPDSNLETTVMTSKQLRERRPLLAESEELEVESTSAARKHTTGGTTVPDPRRLKLARTARKHKMAGTTVPRQKAAEGEPLQVGGHEDGLGGASHRALVRSTRMRKAPANTVNPPHRGDASFHKHASQVAKLLTYSEDSHVAHEALGDYALITHADQLWPALDLSSTPHGETRQARRGTGSTTVPDDGAVAADAPAGRCVWSGSFKDGRGHAREGEAGVDDRQAGLTAANLLHIGMESKHLSVVEHVDPRDHLDDGNDLKPSEFADVCNHYRFEPPLVDASTSTGWLY